MNLFRRVCIPLLRQVPKIATPRVVALSLLTSHLILFPKKVNASTVPNPEGSNNGFNKYEKFSDQIYEQIHETHDIVIVVDPDRFVEHFLDELLQVVDQVVKVQRVRSKRPLKVLTLNEPITEKLVRDFEQKYKITIEQDTIMLLKNKYIQRIYNFNANDYFENRILLINYFKKINKLTQKKLNEFEQILSYLPSTETAVLVYADKSSPQYKNVQTRFCIMQQNDNYQKNEKLHWILIDKAVAEKLGVENIQNGQLFFLQKSSKLNNFQSSITINNKKLLITPAGTLGGKSVDNVMEDLTSAYNDVNVFSNRSFGKSFTKYSIVLELDLNKIPKHEETRLVKAFGELKKHLKETNPELLQKTEFVYLNKTPKDNHLGYQVYIRDDQKYGDRLRQHQETDINVMQKLSVFNEFGQAHSYIYRLDEQIQVSKDSLISFFMAVKNGHASEYFQTQEQPKYKKYSLKLVGKTFQKEVMESKKDFAIFQYSKNCHACGEYGQYYENLALESYKQENPTMIFGRMNNDHNKPSCIQDFPYTPVFMVCKKGIQHIPYVYRNQKFTPELLKSFFSVTNAINLIPEDQFQKLQADRALFTQNQ
ncbi:unnamed protein product [Paramecium octaurelia]|uniref:Thioredoxin domain-containing protein n=1 Tax=Paramecium octaurelia TaxID=43137 RepID=A0A8S1V0Z6_PAROT|nr:unnamed protein product [Paramecium octaurelia]